MSDLKALPISDQRRPQQGDQVRFADGAIFGVVTDVRSAMLKVRAPGSFAWFPLDVVATRSMGTGMVTLSCATEGELRSFEFGAPET